ncbi:MAG: hypothetical protein ACRCW9_09900 [Cetobacterium sp.]
MNCKDCDFCKFFKEYEKNMCMKGRFYLTLNERETYSCDKFFNSKENFKKMNNFKPTPCSKEFRD